MLCRQTLLRSTMRPSCAHQRKGSCSRTVHCIRLNAATTAPKGPLTAVQWPHTVALHGLRSLDTFRHGGQRHPAIPQRMRVCEHGRQGVIHRV